MVLLQIKSMFLCQSYNNLYFQKKGFTEADYTKVSKFDFSDQCPLADTKKK
jgi:N-acetylglutamate synthase-like GNAT family acetyltransferase